MAESFKFIFTGENEDILSKAEGVRRAMRQTMAEADKLEGVMNGISQEVAAQIGKIEDAMNELPKKIVEQGKVVETLTEKWEDQQKAIDNLDKQLLEHKELLELDRKEVEQAQQAYEQAKEKQGAWTDTAKKLKEQLDSAKEGYKAEQEAIRQLNLEKQQEKQTQKEINEERKKEKENLDELKKKYQDVQKEASNLSNAINKAVKKHQEELKKIPTLNEQIADTMKTIGKLSAGYLTVAGAKKFLDSCIDVRKELEQLEIQLNGMFGEKAGNNLLAGLKGIALDSGVYKTGGLAQVAETLNVYGEKTEEILPLIREFGDVAMGNEQKMNSLATAMGRLNTQGTLNSLTLRTLLRAGFNPLEEMARTTGKSMEQLNAEMKAGMITTEMVKDALHSVTSEGGKYYNMTEKLSDSIAGEQGRLAAMIKGIYAQWGKEHEDLIKGGYRLAESLVANLDTIGKAVGVLVATYGTYRAALIAANAVEAVHNGQLVVRIRLLRLAVLAQQALNRAMAVNPYVLAAAAVVGLTTAFIAFTDSAGAATAELGRLKEREEQQAKELEDLRDEIKKNTDAIKDETKSEGERQEALDELKRLLPSVFSKYNTWIELQKDLAKATAEANQQLAIQNNVTLSQNVQHDTQMLEDLKKYRQELNKITFGSDEKQRLRTELVKKYPELFSNNPEHQKNMRENPGVFSHVNFKEQGFMETDIHYVNQLIDQLTKSVGNLNGELARSTGKQWSGLLPKKNIEETRNELAKYEGLLRQLEEQQKPENLIKRWDSQNTDRFRSPMTMDDMERMRIETSTITDNGETLTKEEITRRIKELRIHASTVTKNAGKDYLADAKKAYEDAQKGVKDIIAKRNDVDEKGNRLFPTEQAYQEALREAKELEKQTKAIYEQMGGSTKQDRKDENDAKKRALQEAKYQEEIRKQKQQQERAIKDLEYSTAQARIDAMEDGNQKTLAQLNLDFERQKTELDRNYEDLKQKKIEAERKLWETNPKTKDTPFNPSKVNTAPTKAETDEYEAQLEAITKAHKKMVAEVKREERQAINDYLKEYGTYEQKRLAITEEYQDKINKAKNAGEKLTLQRQMEKELASLDMSKFEKSINWEILFNDLDKVSVQHLQKLKKQLKEALNNDDITAEQAKVISERINAINSQLQTKAKEWQSAFGLVIPELEEMRRLEQESIEAEDRKEQAQKRLNESLEEELEIRGQILDLLEQNGITARGSDVKATNQDSFIQQMQGMGKDTKQLGDLFSKLGKQEAKVAQNTEALAGAEAEAGAAAEVAGGSFAGTVAIIDTIVHKINENVQSMNELLEQMGLAETKFGKGFSKFAESSQYATEAWESLKSGNVMGVANGVYGSLRTLGEAIGEWGGGSLFGSSDIDLEEDIERLTQSNRDLQQAIEGLAEKMEKSAVVDATHIYEEQKKNIEKVAAQTQEMMQRSASDYSNGFLGIGGTHSSSSHINDNISAAEWERISQLLGKSVRGAGDFFSLTSEEMYRVATELTDIYSRIKDYADDGYRDAAQFMDTYIQYWRQLEDLQNAYYEKMTSVSFDSIESDFKNALLDMDSDAEDFADNFEKYLQQAIINSLVSDKYKPLLESWYHAFSTYMEDGILSEAERIALQQGGHFYNKATGSWENYTGWDAMQEQALRDRNALRDQFGWSSDSPEAKKYFDNLRSMWLDTLTDMEADAKDWEREILRIMVEDLIDEFVLNSSFTQWLDDWKKRYKQVMEDEANQQISEAERDRRLQELLDEQMKMREKLAGQAKDIMDNMGYTDLLKQMEDEATDTFEDLRDQFVDALMDMDTDAEEWGKQIAETLARQFIEQQLLNEAFNGMLDEWKEAVADMFKDGFGHGADDDAESVQRLKDKVAELVAKYKELAPAAQEFLEAIGLGKEAESPFSDLRSTYVSTLMDLQADTESFAKQLQKTLTQHLMEGLIDNFTVGDLGFNDWLKKWNEEYMQTFNDLDNPDREEDLDWYISELTKVYEQLLAESEELRDRLKEVDPDTTFKDMKSSWQSALLDMEMTAEEFAKNVRQTMASKIIDEFLLGNTFQTFLDEYQDTFNGIMDGDGTMNEKIAALLPMIDQWVAKYEELAPLAERIREAFGITPGDGLESAFADMRSVFLSSLMSMESDAEQFAKDVARTMTEQMVGQILKNQFQSQFDDWNEAYLNALRSGDKDELERLRQQLIELRSAAQDAAQPLLDTLAEIEAVADTTFKDMRQDWLSALMDMESDTKEWTKNITRLLAQQLVQKFVLNAKFDEWLDNFQNKFNEIYDSSLSPTEMANRLEPLKKLWIEKFGEMSDEVKTLFDLIGYTDLIDEEKIEEEAERALGDLRSTFVSALMDMESDAASFAKNISRILAEAFIDKFVLGDAFDAQMEQWQNQYESILNSGLSEEERASQLKQLRDAIATAKEGYVEQAKAIQDLLGLNAMPDQEATMNMAEKATYDQFELYLGMQTSMVMMTQQGNAVRQQILATLQSMGGITTGSDGTSNYGQQIFLRLGTTNDYLLAIKKSNEAILNQFSERLNNIINKLS